MEAYPCRSHHSLALLSSTDPLFIFCSRSGDATAQSQARLSNLQHAHAVWEMRWVNLYHFPHPFHILHLQPPSFITPFPPPPTHTHTHLPRAIANPNLHQPHLETSQPSTKKAAQSGNAQLQQTIASLIQDKILFLHFEAPDLLLLFRDQEAHQGCDQRMRQLRLRLADPVASASFLLARLHLLARALPSRFFVHLFTRHLGSRHWPRRERK